MRRALPLLVFVLACIAWPGTAAAFPTYDGTRMFAPIHGPGDPEHYTWQVRLGEGQALDPVDDQTVAVRYEDGTAAFVIEAEPAHDATGATVPTTIAVTDVDLITLTVHHLAGNPAAGGAAFAYPISAGEGYETEFATVIVQMPPPTEIPAPAPAMVAPCIVPDLLGRSLKASRKLLRRSSCELGRARGERGKGAKVVKQHRKPGSSFPSGTAVAVKLG